MFDWLRRGRIKVQAHTANAVAHELFFLRKASRAMPQWWLDLPRYHDLHPTEQSRNMRGCSGITDLHRHGFVLVSWCDIWIERTQPSRVSYDAPADRETQVRVELADQSVTHYHPPEQYGDFVDPAQWQQCKIISPWYVEHKPGLKWTWIQPTWSLNEFMGDVVILPGIVDFSEQHATHVNMMIRRSPGSFMIPANTPLVHLIPMTDRGVDLTCHYRSDRLGFLAERINSFTFQNTQNKRKNLLRNLAREPRCPFH